MSTAVEARGHLRVVGVRSGGRVELSDGSEQMLKAMVFTDSGKEERRRLPSDATRAISFDLDEDASEEILDPPYEPSELLIYGEFSSALSSNIDAMVTNVEGFGHRLVPLIDLDSEVVPAEVRQAARLEKRTVDNMLLALPRGEGGDRPDLIELRKRIRRGREATGTGYAEVIRNEVRTFIGLRHLLSQQIRILRQDANFTAHKVPVPQIGENGEIDWIQIEQLSRFRRYVQKVAEKIKYDPEKDRNVIEGDSRTRYFKEYGDPRVIDNETGEVVASDRQKKFEQNEFGVWQPMPEERKASEIIQFGRSERSAYGIVRWASAILSIFGEREALEINFVTIRNNTMPSMALTVSNGRLTDKTIARIKQFIDQHVKGNANYSTFLVIEGESEFTGDESNQCKINVVPLAENQIRDILFKDYVGLCEDRVRESFRIPGLYSGIAGDVNKASADVLKKLADEQVFAPARDETDAIFNKIIFAEWGVKHWRFVSKSPNVTDNKELVAMLVSGERTGGVTPQLARRVLEEVIPNVGDIPEPDTDVVKPNVPYSYQLALAMKNLGMPTEPNNVGPPSLGPADPDEAVVPLSDPTKPSRSDAQEPDPLERDKRSRDFALSFLDDIDQMAETELRRYLASTTTD